MNITPKTTIRIARTTPPTISIVVAFGVAWNFQKQNTAAIKQITARTPLSGPFTRSPPTRALKDTPVSESDDGKDRRHRDGDCLF